MSMIIPNMNLPKGCGDCPFSKGINFKEMRCLAESSLYISDGGEYKRDSKCPLKECNDPEAPEWLYHTPFEDRSWVNFDAVEKALGFRLFGWQKDYILSDCAYAGRRIGKTTAVILHQLLSVNEEPIDFSRPSPSKHMVIFRQDFRDIWEKLRDAGIPMRPVFWSVEDKKRYQMKHGPYKWRYDKNFFDDFEKGEQNDN